MVDHLMLCCGLSCREYEMERLYNRFSTLGKRPKFVDPVTLEVEDKHYIFMINEPDIINFFRGRRLFSYWHCDNVYPSLELVIFLQQQRG